MCMGELGRVIHVDDTCSSAAVRTDGRERCVSLLLHPETQVGDHVIVHSGFVIQVIGAAEAAEAAALRR